MKRVMVDIETLSTDKHAAVLSIGVAVFSDTEVLVTDGWAMDMRDIDGHINPSTVAWWMKQDESAREFSFTGKHHPTSIASSLRSYLADANEVWANDPDFDLVILQNWWERMSAKLDLGRWPVSFGKYRSMRTMKSLATRYYIDTSHVWSGKTAHNPIDDATCQARAVIEVFHCLDRGRGEIL